MLESDGRLVILSSARKSIIFIPKVWRNVLPPIGQHSTHEQMPDAWIDVLVQARGGDLRLRPTVRAAADSALREKIIERLARKPDEFGFRMAGKAKRVAPTMTRIGNDLIYRWSNDELAPDEDVQKLLAERIDNLLEKTAKLPDALRPIVDHGRAGQTA